MAKKVKTYQAQAWIHTWVGVKVVAKDLDEALLKAKELEESDFVEVLGEPIDGSFELTGIYTAE